MAKVVEVQLIAKTDDAVAGVNKVEKAVEKTARSAKKASKELSGLQQAGNEVVKGLDRVTGGLASKFVAVGKAAKLSGKAMKTALISSGIGLAVVAVGLLVEYWDQIGEALGFINKDLENQAIEINKSVEASNIKLASLKNQQTILELQDKSTIKIKNSIKEELLLQVQKNVELLKNLQTQLELEKNSRKEVTFLEKAAFSVGTRLGSTTALAFAARNIKEENEKELELQEDINKANTQAENLKISLLQLDKKANDEKQKAADDANKAAEEAERKAKEAEKERVDAIERIRKGLIDTEAEERAEKLRLIKEDYDEQIALAAEFYGTNSIKILELKAAQKSAEDEQQAVFDEQDKARQDKLDEEEKKRKEKQLADDKKISDAAIKIAELEEEAKRTSLEGYAGAINSLSNTIGQETAAGKGLAVASSLINTYAAITGQLKTAAGSPGGAIPGYAIAQAIATGVAGFAAVKKIVAVQVPGGGGSGSSQTGSLPTVPTPPAFNVVGASGETQLADAIGSQTQRPARAYVVSKDVTTAQEMDRNIIEGASIG